MKLAIVALCAFLSLSSAALAHGPTIGTNGGRQVNDGAFLMEMIVQGSNLIIFIRDQTDRPVQSIGFRGIAVLIVDGRAQRIPLRPAGENRMTGTAAGPLPAQPRGAVQMSNYARGTSIQGRFN